MIAGQARRLTLANFCTALAVCHYQPGSSLAEQFLVACTNAANVMALVKRVVWVAWIVPMRAYCLNAASSISGSFFPRFSARRRMPDFAVSLK